MGFPAVWPRRTLVRALRFVPGGIVGIALFAAALSASAPAYAAVGTWTVQTSHVTPYFTDVSCPSATICYAVGSAGWLDKTTDGGATWTPTNAGAGYTILSISCPTTSTCFTADNTGRVLHTTDGGASWTAQTLSPYPSLFNISCPSTNVCYTANGYTTKDGGATWTQPQQVDGQDISCPSTTMCIAVRGSGTAILQTTDGGATWTVQASIGSTPNAVSCVNTSFCVVGTNQPSILKTIDGGATWTTWTAPGGGIQFYDVACLSPSLCMAPFASASVWLTSDGGQTWGYSDTGTGSNLYATACPGSGACVAVGGNLNGATIARYQAPVPSVTGQPSSGSEGTPGSFTVATLNGGILPYSATIDWGDGSSSTATITSGGVGGGYSVTGNHTYAEEGTFTATVTATDGGASTVSGTSSVTVFDASLTGSGTTLAATEGASVSGVVATFRDADPAAPLSDYSASIDWQDGSSSAGTISANADGSFSVTASHTYSEEKTFYAAVTITDATAKAVATATITVADAPLTATGKSVAAVEGASFSGPVASFTDADSGGTATDYTATITWGDGATSTGTISANASGGFDVTGTHTYAEEGNQTATISISDAGGATTSATAAVAISDAALNVSASPVTAVEGAGFTGVVATFTDTDPSAALSDYAATISWGDGHTSAGAVASVTGGFSVSGTNTYAGEGSNPISVTVSDSGGASATGTGTASVADAAITGTGKTINATEGAAFSGVVANISDTDPAAAASDFGATITWGDGTTSAGTVAANPNGGFDISGSHTYAEEGSNSVSVSISDAGGATATATGNASVSDAALSASGSPVSAAEGAAFSGVVATFRDTDSSAGVSDYQATIAWGDGSSSTGTISTDPMGGFDVTGSHTYADEGTNSITVTIQDASTSASATARAAVADTALSASGISFVATEGANRSGVVAHFTDANPGGAPSDFTATVSWGDGSAATTGTITANPNGGFDVSADHSYAEEGTDTVSVNISDDGGATATASAVATVSDAALTGTPSSVAAMEGRSFNGVVATFADADAAGAAADYTATITWGDGHSSAGTISADPNGGFVIAGANTFAEEGSYSVSVAVHDAGSASTSVVSTASVADAALSATVKPIMSAEGATFSGVVATVTDADPAGVAGDYSATITWGDGTTSAGTLTSNSNGGFDISGTHSYAEEGTDQVAVSIADAGGAATSASGTATVTDAALSASGKTINATEGSAFTGTVASFTDADAAGTAGDYSANIAWGDGTSSAGTIAANGSGGFDVIGSHTFAEGGSRTLSISVADAGGSTTSASGSATVGDLALTASVASVSATEGASFTGTVGSFTDADPSTTVADYSVTIAWGDGHSSAGTVTSDGHGGYLVSGTNTYAEDGSATLSITVTDSGGSSSSATGTATIQDAAISGTASTVNAVEGTQFTGVVATITDGDPAGVAADYTATITWGDGHTSAGTIVANGAGGFTVRGTNTYAEEGTDQVSVTVTDAGGASTTVKLTSTVTDAGLTNTPKSFNATEGVAYSGVVANFKDGDPAGTASDYTASINWGDGHTSAGTIARDGAGGFNVTGTNTYAEEGPAQVTVTIADAGGASVTALPAVYVLDANLSAAPQPLHIIEGAAFSGTVLTFTDANALGSASEFSASITWGDGHATAGTITGSNGTYTVTGANTYAEEGNFNLSVTVNDAGGATLVANTVAFVADGGLTASAKVVTPTEGAPFSGVVASFTDADPAGTASDFSATITWGDGHSSSGTIAANGSGGFNVTGSNTYAEEGSQAVKVSIADAGGATVVANSTANIADAALAVKGKTLTATRRVAFTTTIATFTDADPAGATTDYTATINWGDGSAVTTCPSSSCSFSLSSGTFSVNGTHTYSSKGTYTVTIQVKDSGGYVAPNVTSTITVS